MVDQPPTDRAAICAADDFKNAASLLRMLHNSQSKEIKLAQ